MSLILLVFAFVLACIAAGIPTVGRWQLIAIALACFFLVEIILGFFVPWGFAYMTTIWAWRTG